jgi:Flp pilus assembly protein CpaB
LVRAFRWHRRWFGALFAAIAVLATLNVVSSTQSAGTAVVVAARDISGGSRLRADDLRLAILPSSMVAAGAFTDISGAVGQTVVVGVPERQVLTPSVLLGAESQVGTGKVALPVTFGTSGAVSLLNVGSRVDVLGADATGSGYGVVAADARVAALPASDDSGLLGGATSRLVLLEVNSTQAAAIVAAMAVSSVSFALR